MNDVDVGGTEMKELGVAGKIEGRLWAQLESSTGSSSIGRRDLRWFSKIPNCITKDKAHDSHIICALGQRRAVAFCGLAAQPGPRGGAKGKRGEGILRRCGWLFFWCDGWGGRRWQVLRLPGRLLMFGDQGTFFLFFLSDYFWWWGPGHTHFVVEFSSERQK